MTGFTCQAPDQLSFLEGKRGARVWRLVSGVWRLVSGAWRLVPGVWRLASPCSCRCWMMMRMLNAGLWTSAKPRPYSASGQGLSGFLGQVQDGETGRAEKGQEGHEHEEHEEHKGHKGAQAQKPARPGQYQYVLYYRAAERRSESATLQRRTYSKVL